MGFNKPEHITGCYSDILSTFQKTAIEALWEEFEKLGKSEIKNYKYGETDIQEILIGIYTSKGLTTLIIDRDDFITVSYISENNNISNLYFYEGADIDYSDIAHKFLTLGL